MTERLLAPRHGSGLPAHNRNVPSDVWKRVSAGAPDDCWPWTGSRNRGGYGVLYINRRQARAHRVAYELAKGPIPDGLIVCHRCDNPPCCNPAHLFLGTNLDNQRDSVAKGRQYRGERHHRAKLTVELVKQIRARYAQGEKIAALADEVGVTYSRLSFIVRYPDRTWRDA